MGKIISLGTEQVKPSQNFLKEETVKFILKNYFENRRDLFPPIPLVRFNFEDNNYVVIDGHSLVAFYDLIGENFDAYVVDNNEDYLEDKGSTSVDSNDESLKGRNNALTNKFQLSLNEAKKVSSEGINSFKDLREKYPYLRDLEIAKKTCCV